jgi:predicted ATPase/class 3 adenylate cyclase
MDPSTGLVTFLFTDIEGSSRLWEQVPERMRSALARHDALARGAVERHGGRVVKMLGDGMHAVFGVPSDAIEAIVELQLALADTAGTSELPLRIRCGLHVGDVERRDGDFFGSTVNRAARIMSVAHGGQVLLSHAVADQVAGKLPDGLALRDLGAVRLRDLARPERVFQLLHPKLRQDFPALRSLESTPNNLPQQVTSFVGRDRELAELRRLLRSTRLLTLLGPGGIGKTRMALQAAAEALDDYPDGVWFVDLAPLSNPNLVAQATAAVLGVKDEPDHALVEVVLRYVCDKRMLLVLDNCEHLLHACAELIAQMLRAAADLRVIAGSREALRIAGETIFPVPALAVPDERTSVTIGTLDRYEATRLFVQRATASQPRFEVTERNAGVIVDVCRRLDGIPLAIELAAARVRTLSVEMIAARLSDRFRLLAGGDQTALPRQQTLRALIDWSYDLLAPKERLLLERLSVFAGGWTLEAAESIGADADLDRGDILDVLSTLVDKSLVALDAGGSRYRLLETVRAYAKEHLDHSSMASDVRSRHLEYFVVFAETARPSLNGPDQVEWLSRLDLERENVLAAHEWASHAAKGGELGLRLAYALVTYWFIRGQSGLWLRLIAEALARPSAQARTRARSRALFAAGQQFCFTGRYEQAQGLLEESLAIGRELGDRDHIAGVLQPLGMAAFGRGDMEAARRHMQDAVDLARALGNRRELAAALNGLAQLMRADGDRDRAEALYNDVVSLARDEGDRDSVAIGLLNLSMLYLARGNADRARSMLTEIFEIAKLTGSKPVGQSALDVCAGYCVVIGRYPEAARLFGAAQAQIASTGLQRDPADEAFLLPLRDRARNDIGADLFAHAESDGRALSYDDAIVEAQGQLALNQEARAFSVR